MTITYQRNGDGTGTLNLSLTGEQVRAEELLYNFGLSLFGAENKTEYDLLSNQARLNLIQSFFVRVAKAKDRAVQEWEAEQNLSITDIW